MRILLHLMIVLTALLGATAHAVKVSNLYQVELPVASQSEQEKAKAIKVGFSQLLVKLSGDPQIENKPELKTMLKSPDSYVQEFTYINTPDMGHPYLIQIHFNQADIEDVFKKANTAYWGENRPQILVWLALVNPHKGTTVLGNETGGSLLALMKQRSDQYGLPLAFPAMDVGDLSQITTEDVVQMELPVLREAGKRYSSDALLIGKLEQNVEGYQSQWRLVLSDAQWDWTFTGKTSDLIVSQVLDKVSLTLARHYVSSAVVEKDHQLTLTVSNVMQPADLAQLLENLKQMTSVKQIQLLQITGDKVDVAVQLQASIETFQKNAASCQRLTLKSQAGEDKLIYEWVSSPGAASASVSVPNA